jgi:membrane protein DedA with SNARE-associated domain
MMQTIKNEDMKKTIVLTLVLLMVLLSAPTTMGQAPATAPDESHVSAAAVVAADSANHSGWVVKFMNFLGTSYLAVGVAMTVESSFVPFPSEIVIPPAVMVAADPTADNNMNAWLIILVGTLGALLGAFINYFLSRWLGRPIIYKFVDSKLGHMLSLSGEKMERAEKYFNDHGAVSTFVGRLIPVVRQLISIPAGLSRMNVGVFTLYTFLGAGIWNCILGLLGFLAVKMGGMEFIDKYNGILSKAIIVIFILVVGFLIARHYIKKRKTPTQQ